MDRTCKKCGGTNTLREKASIRFNNTWGKLVSRLFRIARWAARKGGYRCTWCGIEQIAGCFQCQLGAVAQYDKLSKVVEALKEVRSATAAGANTAYIVQAQALLDVALDALEGGE